MIKSISEFNKIYFQSLNEVKEISASFDQIEIIEATQIATPSLQLEDVELALENVLFKISYPAEFHAQTACEAAIQLHPLIKDRLNDISQIIITTQIIHLIA